MATIERRCSLCIMAEFILRLLFVTCAKDAVSGLSAHREALARQMSELGSGAQSAGDHVRRPGRWLTPLR